MCLVVDGRPHRRALDGLDSEAGGRCDHHPRVTHARAPGDGRALHGEELNDLSQQGGQLVPLGEQCLGRLRQGSAYRAACAAAARRSLGGRPTTRPGRRRCR